MEKRLKKVSNFAEIWWLTRLTCLILTEQLVDLTYNIRLISWATILHLLEQVSGLVYKWSHIFRSFIRSDNNLWSLSWQSELQERMWMMLGRFTVFTEIEILANGTLVANSYDWVHVATITDEALMDRLCMLRNLILL